MKKDYYIYNNGELKRKDNTLCFINEDGEKRDIPIETISSIYVFSELRLNTKLVIFLAKYGIEAEAGLGRRLYPLSMQEGAAYLQEKYRLSMSSDKIIAGVGAVVSDFYAAEAPLKPNAAAFLNALREKSIPMAIATSNERSAVEAAFRRLGILQYFTEIFTGIISAALAF